MGEIGPGFVDRADGVILCRRASTQPRDLREDEPHPVALFLPGSDFGEGGLEYAGLCFDEALQLERVGTIDHPCKVREGWRQINGCRPANP